MKSELQKKLLNKYPEFFQIDRKIYTGEKSVEEDVKELINQKEIILPIQFGIETGNGWFWLLDNLMSTIKSYCRNNNVDVPQVTQIKEKYGSLSFYIYGGDRLIDGMIWFAEHLSLNICETCGTNRNVGQTEGWVYTICEKCREKNERAKILPFNLRK